MWLARTDLPGTSSVDLTPLCERPSPIGEGFEPVVRTGYTLLEISQNGSVQPKMEQTMLATCCVPWTSGYELDVEVFRAGVQRQIRAGVKDLYVFGTAGEGYAVDEGLFGAVLREFVEECRAGEARPMAGIVSLSLRTVVGRIERAGGAWSARLSDLIAVLGGAE